MELWIKTSVVLCLFGFLKEFRPSEPFSVHYLTGPWLNFTEDMVAEGFDGLFAAAEVAYYAYIYTSVAKEQFQKVSSYTRSACLLGHSLGAVVGQTLNMTGLMDAHSLFYITVTALSMATIWSLFLPPVKYSLYFHQYGDNMFESTEETNAKHSTYGRKCLEAYYLMKKHLLQAYTNLYVIKWSVWWALACGCYLPAYAYNQLVYETILKENEEFGTPLYNGAVEALSSLLGAGVAFCCGWLRFNWRRVGTTFLAVGSITEGVMIYFFSTCESIWLAYALYTMFVVVFQALITITNAEVARNISEDSYGLIFGMNGLLSLLVKTVIIITIVSGQGLILNIRQQYAVFGYCFAVLGVITSIVAVYGFCYPSKTSKDKVPENVPTFSDINAAVKLED